MITDKNGNPSCGFHTSGHMCSQCNVGDCSDLHVVLVYMRKETLTAYVCVIHMYGAILNGWQLAEPLPFS
jgi:hypothetical protein